MLHDHEGMVAYFCYSKVIITDVVNNGLDILFKSSMCPKSSVFFVGIS
jgi:hypothetical protein